ncbi:MAG: flagellar hook-associated protein FlgK, partial [Parvularculaceae bacterium]|nr:flagellar hook-associated protein FlgK [Parvularculaceae bacterium]
MSVSAAFQNAQAGLSVALRRADIVSSNVSNALTPGYVRRDLAISERTNGAGGVGPQVDGVVRAGDAALTRERRLAEGSSERERTVAEAHQALNRALGEPDDEYSLSSKYQQLESSLRQLATTPESTPNQRQTLEAARTLVASFNDLGARAQSLRENADAAIAKDVKYVNDTLKQIDGLNRDITLAGKGGRDTSSLQDQRQTLINEVSKIIPVREISRQDGGVDLITQEGVFLIAGKSREIEFTARGVITPDLSYNGGAGALSGISVAGVDITPGGTRPSQSIRGGSLSGHFAVRDEIIPSFTAQIDSLAADLVQRFEESDPTRATGAPGLFTDAGAAYASANEVGLASRLALNPAVDPDRGGALWRVR